MPRAIEEVRRAIAILPKRPLYRNNLALYASYGGDFKTGEEEARAVQELDLSYPTGFVALACPIGTGEVGGRPGVSRDASGRSSRQTTHVLFPGRSSDARWL